VRRTSLVAVVCILGGPGPIAACSIECTPPSNTSCVCAPNTGPCDITTNQPMVPGAVITCTGQDVRLTGAAGNITVANGVVTVRARDLIVDPEHKIQATAANAAAFGIALELSGKLDLGGFILANSPFGGGVIGVSAAGDILVKPGGTGIVAKGTASEAGGGDIDLRAEGNVEIDDPVIADGSAAGITTGGAIAIRGANITIRDNLSASGHNDDAGDIVLDATPGTLDVQSPIKAEGGGIDGNGGLIEITAGTAALGALLSAQGGVGASGGQSNGGSVSVTAWTGGVSINADIDVTGGASGAGRDGGAIVVESLGPVTVANGVTLRTKSDANGGDGGDILLSAGGALTVGDATLDARGDWGPGDEGSGARIALDGCAVSVAAGATLDSRGFEGGVVHLSGRETLTVSANSVVDVSGVGGPAGKTTLFYRVPGRCSGDPSLACEPGACTGTCSNNSARPCSVNSDCTVGCSAGECQNKHCTTPPNGACATDGDCTGCGASGPCPPNPDTGGTTAQFLPAPPTMTLNRNIPPCG